MVQRVEHTGNGRGERLADSSVRGLVELARVLVHEELLHLDREHAAVREPLVHPLGEVATGKAHVLAHVEPVASHLLGYVIHDDSSSEGENAFFSYRLPDYRGVVGIEGALDPRLRGRAGAKSVVVNSLGYRQTDEVWSGAEPGQNVVLTIDVRLQKEAEKALRIAGYQVEGAVVVMDVHSGDVLALVSSPATDPNNFISGFTPAEYARWTNEVVRMQRNRATQEHYHPGSVFKPIVGLACLEMGLNPNEKYQVQPDPNSDRGVIYVGRDRQRFKDTATPGEYDFTRAIAKSSNSYFITNGLRFGVEKIIELGQRLHLIEKRAQRVVRSRGFVGGRSDRGDIFGDLPPFRQPFLSSAVHDRHVAVAVHLHLPERPGGAPSHPGGGRGALYVEP